MAMPMRRPEVDGWYHVMGRGLERRERFTEDRERERFLDLLAAVHETQGLVIHAYVPMDNHYHLVVQTPQWLTTEAILVRHGKSWHHCAGIPLCRWRCGRPGGTRG